MSWLRGAWISWLRGACTSCRAPASDRGACTSWLLAVCVSIALADATSGGQDVSACAIPAVADSENIVITLNPARNFFIASVLSDCVLALRSPAASPAPHLAPWGPDSHPHDAGAMPA